MSKALKSVTVWIAGTAVVLTLAACSSTPDEETPAPASSVSTMESQPPEALEPEDSTQPINPDEDLGEQQTFDGEGMMVETITANNMEIEVPKGIRIPETALVTEATKSSIMMADDDPAAITDMINTSAEEAGSWTRTAHAPAWAAKAEITAVASSFSASPAWAGSSGETREAMKRLRLAATSRR